MKYRILLACAGGFSTSMLVEKMKESAKKRSIEIGIEAIAEGRIAAMIDSFDILMLGPQVSHLETKLKRTFASHNVPITTIPMMDYGMMDGEKVLKQAIDLINKEKENVK